jgi:hypothetical protein
MAAINVYSNVLERGDLPGIRGSSPFGGEAEERRSPVELQLSEVEEILEQNTAAVPELESSQQQQQRQDGEGSRTAWTASSDPNDETSAAEEEGEGGEEESSSDTMTESQEDVLSTETPSERRRMSLADGFWACLSPVVSTFWKGGREKVRQGAASGEDTFEIAFPDIKQLEFVGSGAQGAVFSGEYRGEKVAVKKVKDKSYCKEICQLRKLSHRNIIQFRGVCTKQPCFCVVMEFCAQGNLYDHIRSTSEILPPQVVCWARQIADGMLYLHSKKIIHRDLKSLNILMCDNDSVKISDFGTSRTIGDNSTRMTFAGTVAWMSPEMLRHEPCSEKVDVWSYAVLLWEMLTREKPYNVRVEHCKRCCHEFL